MRVSQLWTLLLVLGIGVNSLIPNGLVLCFKPCGNLKLELAHQPHSCDHSDVAPGCAEHSSLPQGDDHSEDSPVLGASSVAPTPLACTDLSPDEVVGDRGRAHDSMPDLGQAATWSPLPPPQELEPRDGTPRLVASIPRRPSPDIYSLPLRV